MKLTPVQQHNGIYYKRDDFYAPFGENTINGGKVRQAVQLFDAISEDVKNNHNGGVVTATSIHSPQGAIIAKVAQEHGIKCIVAVGGTKPKTLHNHHLVKLTESYGAEVRNVAGHGMTSVIDARIKDTIIPETGYKLIKFAISLENNPEAIFDGVTEQVQNIPDELDNLIIPVGSGIQFTGILRGLKKYNKKVKRVIGVAFVDRRKVIDGYLERFKYENFPEEVIEFSEYEMYLTKHAYSKPIWEKVGDDYMDEIYEGKAHEWMRENIDENEKTLFWIVGRRCNGVEVENIIHTITP